MIATPTAEANRLLLEGSIMLAEMTAQGFCVDTAYVERKIKEVNDTIAQKSSELEQTSEFNTWQQVYGPKTNLGSRNQLRTVMYDHLGYRRYVDKKTAKEKMDITALDKIDTPFTRNYLAIAKLEKLKGTYLEGLLKETVNGKVHPFFSFHNIDSYRTASQAVNIQNITKRNPEIAAIARGAYIPRPGNQIVEIDYSQLEVRISACYHKDPVMMKYLLDPNSCMHTDTAMELFGLTRDQVSRKGTRDISKNMFVFPQFYGSTYFNCAENIWHRLTRQHVTVNNTDISILDHLAEQGIDACGDCDPQKEPDENTFEYRCKQVQDSFWNKRFTVYTDWKKRFWEAYLEKGFFRMKTGFVCTSDLRRNQVLNYPVQGSASHCLVQACILINAELKRRRMKSRLVAEIHDALVGDCPPSEVYDFAILCRNIMIRVVPKMWQWIITPLDVEADACPRDASWANPQPLKF